MDYKTLENHIAGCCEGCRKKKEDEPHHSFFHGSKHYVAWTCSNCGNENWWKTDHFSSGIDHIHS